MYSIIFALCFAGSLNLSLAGANPRWNPILPLNSNVVPISGNRDNVGGNEHVNSPERSSPALDNKFGKQSETQNADISTTWANSINNVRNGLNSNTVVIENGDHRTVVSQNGGTSFVHNTNDRQDFFNVGYGPNNQNKIFISNNPAESYNRTPVQRTLVQPTLAQPTSFQPSSAQSKSVQPLSVGPALNRPGIAQPAPIQPAPVQPPIVRPALNRPGSVQPAPVQPPTVGPALYRPRSVQPVQVQPPTVGPAVYRPRSVQPAPVQPPTIEPALHRPGSVQTVPSQPKPVQRPIAGRTLYQPTPVLPTSVRKTSAHPASSEIENQLKTLHSLVKQLQAIIANLIQEQRSIH